MRRLDELWMGMLEDDLAFRALLDLERSEYGLKSRSRTMHIRRTQLVSHQPIDRQSQERSIIEWIWICWRWAGPIEMADDPRSAVQFILRKVVYILSSILIYG